MQNFFKGIKRVCRLLDATAIVLHHDNKEYVDRGGRYSGGGSFNGSIQGLAKADAWIRAFIIKQVPNPDDPRHEEKVNIVRFELFSDNYGGQFKEVVAVRKNIEDATSYLSDAEEKAEVLLDIMYRVLRDLPKSSENAWKVAVHNDNEFKERGLTLGNGVMTKNRLELMKRGLVIADPSPKRKDLEVYSAVE
jgi:hypothetical protein